MSYFIAFGKFSLIILSFYSLMLELKFIIGGSGTELLMCLAQAAGYNIIRLGLALL